MYQDPSDAQLGVGLRISSLLHVIQDRYKSFQVDSDVCHCSSTTMLCACRLGLGEEERLLGVRCHRFVVLLPNREMIGNSSSHLEFF